MQNLKKHDSVLHKLIQQETNRQQNTLSLIPSENILPSHTNEATASCLVNKYAEGYPNKRYYQGMEFVDQIETLAQERAKKLFNVAYANVQPYSGSICNLEAYLSIINPGDKIMGLNLSSGGHLTHGNIASFTGKIFKSVSYDVDQNGELNYKQIEALANKEKPNIIIAGTTAYSKTIDWQKFAKIAKKINAYFVADISHIAGLVASGSYPSPAPFAHIMTSTTHKTLRGPRGAILMVTHLGLKKDPQLIEKIQKTVFPGMQGGPSVNIIAGIANCLKEASSKQFKTYTNQIIKNSICLCNELKKYNFKIISNTTESHLFLIDLQNKNIIGNLAAEALEAVNIVVNKNSIPFDQNPPFYPSGIRLGTPSITTRGLKEKEIKQIAKLIHQTIDLISKEKQNQKISPTDEKKKETRSKLINSCQKDLNKIKKEVLQICKNFQI